MAIAIFDFDGTIISRDSLPDFLIQACGRKAFLLRLPWIILLKGAALTGILSTHRAKELVITSFLRGMKTEDFQQACLEYASRIPAFVYPAALEEIRRHQEEGNKIAIILRFTIIHNRFVASGRRKQDRHYQRVRARLDTPLGTNCRNPVRGRNRAGS